MNTRIADGRELQPNPPEAPMTAMGQKPPSPTMNELSAFSPKAVLVAGPNETDTWAINL